MSSPNGISLQVTVHIAPENVDKFFAAFKPVFDAVCAEPELTFFELYRDPDEPGKLSWVENWNATREWFFANQMTKEYYREYLAVTEAMFIKPREFKILDRLGAPYYVVKQTS